MYSLAELRPGMTIVVDNNPYLVLSANHAKQGRAVGVTKTSLKNILTGSTIQRNFQGNEKLEQAQITYTKAQYLYHESDSYNFMDNQTFEQFTLSKEDLGDKAYFLIEGTDVDIQNYEGKPINVQLPPKVNLKVIETEPGVRGDTASGGTKPATLQTGYVVQVPLFMNEGDLIRVNTETGLYVERA